MFLSILEQLVHIQNLTNDSLVDFISQQAQALGHDVWQDQFDNCIVSCKGDGAKGGTAKDLGIVIPLCSLAYGANAKVLENIGKQKLKQNLLLNLGEKKPSGMADGKIDASSKYLLLEDSSPKIATLSKVALALNLMQLKAKCPFKIIFTPRDDGKFVGAKMLDLSKIGCKNLIALDGGEYNKIFTSNMDSSLVFCKLNMNKAFASRDNGFKTFKLQISCYPKIKRNLFGKRKIVDDGGGGFCSLFSLAKFISKDKFMINSINYVDANRVECVFSTLCDELRVKAKLLGEYILQKQNFPGLKIDCTRQPDNFLVLENTENFVNFVLSLHNLEGEIGAKTLDFEFSKGEFSLQVLSADKKDLDNKESRLKTLANEFGASMSVVSTINHFEADENGDFVAEIKQNFVGFGEIRVEKGNFASELGIFQKKIKKCECVCISPTILDENLHGERVEYASAMNTFLWLKKLVCED